MTTTLDKNRLSVSHLSQLLSNNIMDPIELFERSLEKAKNSNSIFTFFCESIGRKEAEYSYLRFKKNKKLSNLDGIPVCWKDNIDIANCPTSNGSIIPESKIPKNHDAYIVECAKKVGLTSIGKTNLSELAFSGIGINSHFGTPYRSKQHGEIKVPGGSSSGSAIAVAEGIVPFAVGTDTAGSIRIPAAFNGLVGYRPTASFHRKEGIVTLSPSLDSVGTLANNVSDCLSLNNAMNGCLPQTIKPADINSISVTVDESLIDMVVTDENVKNDFYKTINSLSNAGVKIKTKSLSSIQSVFHLIQKKGWLGSLEAYLEHYSLINSYNRNLLERRTLDRLNKCSEFTLKTYAELMYNRSVLQKKFHTEIESSLLMIPTVGHYAPTINSLKNNNDLFSYINLKTLQITMIGSYLDLPTFAMPNIASNNVEYSGFQISRPRNEDANLSSSALTIEKILYH
ncbi:amidase family protein [Grimontia hollisae]|uniref:amidase family protein n=1 Tax=Grimontia hollisae TaxID=673 RepID=UPI00165E1B75|nr:amidase family protein [Grimontia hollisae]